MNSLATIEDVIDELMARGEARVTGFGLFTLRDVPERDVRLPDGRVVHVPAYRKVSFRPSKKARFPK